jgi:hypothetical protein
MIASALSVPPLDERPPHPLELPVRSLAALAKQRASERDEARLERDLARRERDTLREMLSLALTQLHDMTVSNRRLQERLRRVLDTRPGGYLDTQQREYAA